MQTYEIFKGAKLNFYYQTIPERPSPIASIGMTHRTTNGLILVIVDVSNGGLSAAEMFSNGNGTNRWQNWVRIYTGHCCERYSDRIMKNASSTFQAGVDAIMYADEFGVARVIDNISEELQEIELQFKEGRYFGYRDSKSKVTYFRTVISKEMEKGDQLEFRDEWRETLDRLNDLFKWD